MSDITEAVNTGIGVGMTLGIASMAMDATRRMVTPGRRKSRRKASLFNVRK